LLLFNLRKSIDFLELRDHTFVDSRTIMCELIIVSVVWASCYRSPLHEREIVPERNRILHILPPMIKRIEMPYDNDINLVNSLSFLVNPNPKPHKGRLDLATVEKFSETIVLSLEVFGYKHLERLLEYVKGFTMVAPQ
jgi:hypothetical protein